MELWVHLAHGSFYFLKLKWKEWESPEHCLYIYKKCCQRLYCGIMRIGPESGKGGRGSVVPFLSPPPLCRLVLYCTELGWVRLFLFFCSRFPEHKNPFFPCQSQPDVPRLVLRILTPRSVLFSAAREPHELQQMHNKFSRPRKRTSIHTHNDAQKHTFTEAL